MSGPRTSRRPVGLGVLLLAVLAPFAGGCAASGRDAGASLDPSAGSSVSSVAASGPTRVTANTSTTHRSTEYRTSAGSSGERLVVVGDSITNEGRTELAAVLGRDHRVVIDGRPGFLVAQQQSTAEALASARPSIVLVELGTNDIMFGRDVVQSAMDMRRIVGTFTEARCIVLVTVGGALPASGAPERARRLGESYRSIAASDARIRLVELDAVVAAAESDPSFVGPFFYDGIHPTANGQARLAASYEEAITTCGS